MNLLLASGSPRRLQLLRDLGYSVSVVRPDFDERSVRERDPGRLVEALAKGKGRSVLAPPGTLLVAADTIVYFNGRVLGKPKDAEEAFAILSALSGRSHEVYTGVYLQKGGSTHQFHDRATVRFRTLQEAEIRAYIQTGSPLDKAGAYGVQDSGFVAEINGSYHTVMGFPTALFQQLIQSDTFGKETNER